MWFTLFLISTLINTVLFFYVKWLLNTVAAINEDVSIISTTIQGFLIHLQGVHELETFYGDQTLKNLLIHSQDLVKQLEDIDLVLNTNEGGEIAEEAQKED
mgnify:CR=1 FL=1|tara:strand:+ start:295 stop:597 length:303 start_codon:yes stop_codon:yes gene_type:complete